MLGAQNPRKRERSQSVSPTSLGLVALGPPCRQLPVSSLVEKGQEGVLLLETARAEARKCNNSVHSGSEQPQMEEWVMWVGQGETRVLIFGEWEPLEVFIWGNGTSWLLFFL